MADPTLATIAGLDDNHFSGGRRIAAPTDSGEDLPQILRRLATEARNTAKQTHLMAVLGDWAVDGDGAETNGAGMVGVTPTLTTAATAFCKIEDDAVFADCSAAAAEAGYAANFQLFPDTPVAAEDFVYFGNAVPFAEVAFDASTPAVYDSTAVLEPEYWDGSAWQTLTIEYDGTEATAQDGTEAWERDGAMSFIPPTDWASSTIDSQAAYWIRFGIASGKAANMTTVPILADEHKIVTPGADGWVAPCDGAIVALRLNDAASTLHTTADVKFILVNFTTGAHSGELTFAQDQRTEYFSGLSLAIATGDVLGVVVTQEDGTNEPTGVLFELHVASADA